MSSEISIIINGTVCKAKEGEYILNVARANGIFIPAICYVTNCSPTLACRLCIAEVDGKRAYTCNAKAKDGQIVITNSPEIEEERKSIMEVYAINHPLECGVCDQSGECELQNYVLEMGINEQHYTIRNTHAKIENWGLTRYDPSLCIVCERCVTVCKDKVGESTLKTTPRGEGLAVPKEYKDVMSKESFAVWNKMQKSLITKSDINGDVSCSDCGQCAEICPVGALVVSDFHYTSNSWELRKIPAANPHSSDCELIYYEVKQTSISDASDKIYRVEGDKNFSSVNGAARFGFDFENRVSKKDEEVFKKAIDFIKNRADTIKFNSFITNEEALILQKLKEKLSLKLVNNDAFRYQRFIKKFSKTTGKSLYSGDLDKIKNSDFIVSFASFLRSDSPNSAYAVNSALKMNKANAIYAHPITDKIINNYSKNTLHVKYSVGTEELFLYALLDIFANKDELDKELINYIDSFKTKVKKTIKESVEKEIVENVIKEVIDDSGEKKEISEEITKKIATEVEKEIEVDSLTLWEMMGLVDLSEQISLLGKDKDKKILIVGEDALIHNSWDNIAYLCGLLEINAGFDVVIIPSQTNTLGVSLICELDENVGKNILGYNEKSDFKLSALGNGNLDMPALNQQEGTFTNINKRVVPTNAALHYYGYVLNDIANKLDIGKRYTIDFTEELPQNSGYKDIRFDNLPNFYEDDGYENRGYLLDVKEVSKINSFSPKEYSRLQGDILYKANPILQFSPFTNKARQLNTCASLYVSEEFLEHYNLSDKQNVKLKIGKNIIAIKVEVDKKIEGLIPYIPTFDEKLDIESIFKEQEYRFANFEILGVGNE